MYDIIIIGGGPAGLTAAIYALRAMRNVLVIESEVFGGQITQATLVENYPGIAHISGMELGNNMKKQADSLGMLSVMGTVTKVQKEKNIFSVWVGDKVYQSFSVICATGASPKKLEIECEEKYLGSGVSYCATCDGNFFKNKTVSVIGGGNTAVNDAIYLANICEKVYVIVRKNEFRAEPILVEELKKRKNVEILFDSFVKEIKGNHKVERILVSSNHKMKELVLDGVFIAIGRVSNTYLLKDLMKCRVDGSVLVNLDLETEVPGLFLAGDIRSKSVRQLTTATSDGTIASIMACRYLNTL